MNEHSFILIFGTKEGQAMAKKNDSTGKYERILDGAATVFAKEGFHQATVAKIAKAAGVADGTIYIYFKNKDDILVQFLNFKTRQVFSKFRQVMEKSHDAVTKLRNLIGQHFAAFQADIQMAVIYQSETRRNRQLVEKELLEMAKMYVDIVSAIIKQGQEEGVLSQDLHLPLARRMIVGTVEDVINSWIQSGGKYELKPLADPLVELLINGLGVREAG